MRRAWSRVMKRAVTRRSTDRLYPSAHVPRAFGPSSLGLRGLTPREQEALRIVTEHPGISVAGLREALGLSGERTRHIIGVLEMGHIRADARAAGQIEALGVERAR